MEWDESCALLDAPVKVVQDALAKCFDQLSSEIVRSGRSDGVLGVGDAGGSRACQRGRVAEWVERCLCAGAVGPLLIYRCTV